MLGIHLDISQQGKIIASSYTFEMGAKISGQRLVAARGFGQGIGIHRIGK